MAQNGGAAGIYSGINGAVMPSAGHHADMQTLMQNLETLSGWLQQNREDWILVQQGLERVERLQSRTGGDGHVATQLPNGDSLASNEVEHKSPTHLKDSLVQAQSRIAALERSHADQLRLQQLYEDTLADATERIRNYCFEQQNYINDLHRHYTQLLQQSRYETIEAQLTHQGWQCGLQNVSEGVREALKARAAEGLPWKSRIAALKEENRILRAKVGWDPPIDSEGEEEEPGNEDGLEDRRSRSREGPLLDSRI